MNFGSNIAKLTFSFFVFVFLYYYFLKDGQQLLNSVKKMLPFTKHQNASLVREFKTVARTIFIVNISSAAFSGVVAYIGFSLFDLQGALIWALLAGILSLIPTIGTFIVYLLGWLIVAYTTGLFESLLMIGFYFVCEVGLVQNVIKSKLFDDKIPIHPILVFFALTGGVHAFGAPGILYGPLIMMLSIMVFDFLVVKHSQ